MKSLFFKLTVSAALLCSGNTARAAAEADLAVSYTATYASSNGGEDNSQVIIANAITGSNAINKTSGTGAAVRIVGYRQSAQDNTNLTTVGGIVGWLNNNDSRIFDVVTFGSTVGADLVTYICTSTDTGIGAVASQPGMYSSFQPSAFWSAVVAHELSGHNYGRSHSDGLLNPKTIMLHNYCGGGAAPPYLFTNPNIWFNNVRLLGDANNCSQGGLINGGDNSLPSAASAQGVADRRERVIVGPNISNVVRRWKFNRAAGAAPAGTSVTDQVSGANPAVVRGNGAIFTGTSLRTPGGGTGNAVANSITAYIDLPNGIISSNTNLTIEIWATPISAPSYARIFDFGRPVQAGDGLGVAGEYTGTPGSAAPGATQSSDDIMLSAAVGTNINTQRLEAKLNGTAVTLDSAIPTTAGVQHHYAITFTDTATGGRWQWYRDGDAVAYRDVTFHLADIEDVNNWLGRSLWSADGMANNDYAEVRISNVAMSRDQILANYLLGPNYDATATVMMNGSDANGASSFSQAGQWSNAATPSAGNSYETFGYTLRTPASSGAAAFPGGSLKISGGRFLYKGTGASSVTINDLRVSNATLMHSGTGTCTLVGGLAVGSEGGKVFGASGSFNLSANLSGGGSLTHVGNSTTLSGTNTSFTGKTLIGDGNAGGVTIDSKSRLGATPASLVSDQLTFNRGTLSTTATMALDDANRGILFDTDGGFFNVAAGTTLTVTSPLASPFVTSAITVGSINKRGSGTLVLGSTSSSFNGILVVDSNSTTANDGVVKVTSSQALANARLVYINNNNAGSSILQLDGTAATINLPRVQLAGRTVSTPAVENLAGTNNIGGLTVMAGGGSYLVQSDAGLLNVNGPISAGITGTRTITFQGNGDMATLGTVSEGSADLLNVAKSGTGSLTLTGACTHNGSTTVNAGTLKLNGSITTASGTLTAATGATLSGTGNTNATVTVNGNHAPGNPVGTQTFTGTLNYTATARLKCTLQTNSNAANASGKVSGGTVNVAAGAALDFVLNGAGSTVNFTDIFWSQPRTWAVMSGTAITGTFSLGSVSADSGGRSASDYGTFALQQSATAVNLTYTPLTPTELWRRANFGADWSNPAISGDAVDGDADGLSNLLEYALGSDPNTSDVAVAPQVSIKDGKLKIAFNRNTAASDVILIVTAADDPGGAWNEIARSTGGAPFTVTAEGATVSETGTGLLRAVRSSDVYFTTDTAHPKRFLRLEVMR